MQKSRDRYRWTHDGIPVENVAVSRANLGIRYVVTPSSSSSSSWNKTNPPADEKRFPSTAPSRDLVRAVTLLPFLLTFAHSRCSDSPVPVSRRHPVVVPYWFYKLVRVLCERAMNILFASLIPSCSYCRLSSPRHPLRLFSLLRILPANRPSRRGQSRWSHTRYDEERLYLFRDLLYIMIRIAGVWDDTSVTSCYLDFSRRETRFKVFAHAARLTGKKMDMYTRLLVRYTS